MKVVIDTNVVISGLFFGGKPRKVLEAVIDGKCIACASIKIIDEYSEVLYRFINKIDDDLSLSIFEDYLSKIEMTTIKTSVNISRDFDDNKFIECAIDSESLFVVSGDKDLLILEKCGEISIVTAKDFVDNILNK